MDFRALGAGVLLATLLRVNAAHAEADEGTRAAARVLGSAGVAAYQANDFKTANDKLGRAYKALQVPSLGLWSARSLVKVGKLLEAAQRYLDVTRLAASTGDTAVQKQAQADAQTELNALTPRIPSVVVKVNGADASVVDVTIDDAPLSSALVGEARPVNPGKHLIKGTRGSDHVEVTVTLAESEQKTALLQFTPQLSAAAAAAAPRAGEAATRGAHEASTEKRSHTLAWAALGAGGAGLVLGTVTGLVVLSKKSSILSDSRCNGNLCPPSERSNINSYNSLRTVSTVSFIAGGVLAATGLVLYVTAPKTQDAAATGRLEPSVALRLTLGGAALQGSF